jgi:hypothetical protein
MLGFMAMGLPTSGQGMVATGHRPKNASKHGQDRVVALARKIIYIDIDVY